MYFLDLLAHSVLQLENTTTYSLVGSEQVLAIISNFLQEHYTQPISKHRNPGSFTFMYSFISTFGHCKSLMHLDTKL